MKTDDRYYFFSGSDEAVEITKATWYGPHDVPGHYFPIKSLEAIVSLLTMFEDDQVNQYWMVDKLNGKVYHLGKFLTRDLACEAGKELRRCQDHAFYKILDHLQAAHLSQIARSILNEDNPKDLGKSFFYFVDLNNKAGDLYPVVEQSTEKPNGTRLLPLTALGGLIPPLLVFKPDPRKQFWRLELVARRMQYLGEFDSWDAAKASWVPHTPRADEDHLQLDVFSAIKLLRTFERVQATQYFSRLLLQT